MENHQANNAAKFYKLSSFPPEWSERFRNRGLLDRYKHRMVLWLSVFHRPHFCLVVPREGHRRHRAPTVGVAAARDLECPLSIFPDFLQVPKLASLPPETLNVMETRALHGVRRFGDWPQKRGPFLRGWIPKPESSEDSSFQNPVDCF